jgi:propanol-preferring alcohol dehydrogenase
MRAMVLQRLGPVTASDPPLVLIQRSDPVAGPGEVLIRVAACGVCHTELDEIEGRTPPPRLPVVLGHEVVGRVIQNGPGASRFQPGQRVGVAWFWSACGRCGLCSRGLENLCAEFKATGRDADGGYAERMVVPEASAFPIPDRYSDAAAAPLLCAGAVGYRSLRLTGIQNGQTLGLTGFGASGHLVLKMARHCFPDTRVFVFARNPAQQDFALELGAVWAGHTEQAPPQGLDAIIDTTPVWRPVIAALASLAPGGRLVINAIRKEDRDRDQLAGIDYPTHLWMEKEIKSVANVTRRDLAEFLELAGAVDLAPEVQIFPLAGANDALIELTQGRVRGAKVLQIERGTGGF